MKRKIEMAGKKMKLAFPIMTQRATSALGSVSTPLSMPCKMQTLNGFQLTKDPYKQPSQTPKSQSTKKRSLRRPTQQFVKGQWWSILSTQRRHMLQWWERAGFTILHFLQMLLSAFLLPTTAESRFTKPGETTIVKM